MTTVYHLPNTNVGGSGRWKMKPTFQRSRPSAYHTDPACRYIVDKDRVRISTVEKAENRGLEPCNVCAKDDDTHGVMTPTECPLCGERTDKQLALHIRHDCTAK